MRLFILERNSPGQYDVLDGVVVRARDHHEARRLASNVCGDEGKEVWLSAPTSTCKVLKIDGPAAVILRDFNNG